MTRYAIYRTDPSGLDGLPIALGCTAAEARSLVRREQRHWPKATFAVVATEVKVTLTMSVDR